MTLPEVGSSRRRKIRLIEGIAKCRHLKNLPVKEGIYLSEAQNPIPPPFTLYTCIQYTYSIHTGKGGCHFATGVVDTGGKFAAGIVDTSGYILPPVSFIPLVHLDLQISPRIFEKFEMVLMEYSGAGAN
jgi:hypothetical protein